MVEELMDSEPELKKRLKERYKMARLIWLAVFFSPITAAILITTNKMPPYGPLINISVSNSVVNIFFISVAILYSLFISLLEKRVLSPRTTPYTSIDDGDPTPLPIKRITNATMLSYARALATTVFGVLLFDWTHNLAYTYLLFTVSLLFILLSYPRFKVWEGYATGGKRDRE